MLSTHQSKVDPGAKLVTIPTVRKFYRSPELRRLVLPCSGGVRVIDPEQVLFLEADGNYTRIYLSDGSDCFISKSLKEFDRLRQDYPQFIRIHRSFIVNAKFITRFSPIDGLSLRYSEQAIPVSRRHKKEFQFYLQTININ